MIDYEVIKKCDFPILKIKNFIDKDNLVKMKNEIKKLAPELKYTEKIEREYSRIYMDMFSEEMLKIYMSINETAFKLLHTSSNHETQLTVYGNKGEYKWHNDDIVYRLVNWILFIDIDSDFTGGENEISNDNINETFDETYHEKQTDIVTKHEDNVLIMMPCWVTHRVAPVFCKSKDILKGRISINGHIGYRS